MDGATAKGHAKETLEKCGPIGKPLLNTLSINRTPPVTGWWLIKQDI